ncbi:PAS domain-containing protein [Aureimonas sp. AU20]|uniref:PAS domain-containing protein n=1 Tax=Aureimonas sp. AU20 TaxID=1349819 RepID=UPI000720BCE1|nr:PAS domain-containing protein [Aureimonas sp. AU20]ALN75318.1 hypothetical protein M673_21520 [Aureimonas sp. AU20]
MIEPQPFLRDGGEMGRRMRDHDWSTSPLGPPETWPRSLGSVVALMLGSKFPMFLAWGPELGFLYNDAYSEILGARHPAALGRPFQEIWSEIWADILPLIEKALDGEASWLENLPLTLRRNGYEEETYFTFSYSPAFGDGGEVVGMFCACTETTRQVLAERGQARERERQHLMLRQMPGFSAILEGPEHRFQYGNEAFGKLVGEREVEGRTMREAFPEFADQGYFELLDEVFARAEPFAAHGKPLRLAREGGERFVDLVLDPIRDDAGAVRGLFLGGYDVTDRVRADRHREALMRLEERLRDVPTPAGLTLAATELLGETLNCARVGYGTIHAASGTIAVDRHWTAPGFESLAGLHRFEEYGSYIEDIRLGRAVANADVERDPRTAERAEAFRAIRVRAFLDVPVMEQGQATAQLFVHSAAPRRWSEAEIAFVRDFAERTHAAIARRLAEQELRDGRARLGTALAVSRLGTYEWDLTTDIIAMDETAGRFFGFPPGEEVTLLDVRDRVDPRDLERITTVIQSLRDSTARLEIEYRLRLPDGTGRTLVSTSDAVPGADGEADRRIGVFQDVTARRRSEVRRDALVELGNVIRDLDRPSELVHAAAAILGAALDVGRVGYGTVDHDSETMLIEREWTAPDVVSISGSVVLRHYGTFVDELKRGQATVIADTRLDPRTSAAGAELEEIGATALVNVPVIERGRLAALLYVNDAAARQWSGDDLDLVREFAERLRAALERSRTAEALRASEGRLRELNERLESEVAQRTDERDQLWTLSEDMLARADLSGMMTAVSPAWTRVLGWSEAELLARPYASFMHPDDEGPTLAGLARMGETKRPTRFENRIATTDGGWKPIEWTVAPEEDGVNFIAVGRDLSAVKAQEAELEAAQEALRQSQKMEAVGQLTGGIAHDFNNLLAGISGSLEMMQTRIGQGRVDEIERYMQGAQGAAKRAAALTHRLLAFSRRQTLAPKPTDVNRLVAEMEELIQRTVGPGITVETVGKPDLWSTLVDPPQLENALLNLCINARDAMPDGGKLTIETNNVWLDQRAGREQDLDAGPYVTMCVTDTGTGMAPDVIERAFDPFFTTKPIGLGTGLGLSMIYGFARQSGGQVRITSELGRGTTLCIYLPRHHGAEEAAAAPPQAPSAIEPVGAGETVLVIDDEPLVRMLVVDVLEDLGYTAIEAGDGPEGLKVLRSDQRIDLLVTDVGLPNGMNGRQVADAARELRPGLKVLFVTGYAENAVLGQGNLEAGMQVVTKPFDMRALADRIRSMIKD